MPTTPASYETKDLKRLKVADLRAILESKGLDATGKKDELIEKVQASANDAPEPAPAPAPAPEPEPEPEKSPPAKKPAAKKPAAKETPAAEEEDDDDDEPRRANNFFFSTADADDDDDDDDEKDEEPAPEPEAPVDEDDDRPATDTRAADAAADDDDDDGEIYVGFLGENCNREFVAHLLRPFFECESVRLPMQSAPGGGPKRPKGYAFARAPRGTPDSVVAAAVEKLNGSASYPGAKHPLKVARATRKTFNDDTAGADDDARGTKRRRDDGRREGGGDGSGGGGGGGVPRGKSPNRLYVLGLPRHVTEVLLKEFFGKFGAVTDARVLASRDGEDDGGPRRGTVTFASAADAARARAETDDTRAFHGGGELKVVYSNLRDGEGARRGGGGGGEGGAGGGASAQPWSVYPMQPGMPMYTPMAAVALDPATGQPIAPTGAAAGAGAGPADHPAGVPPTGLSEAGYTGVHLAGLPPSATVDAKYAHLYE